MESIVVGGKQEGPKKQQGELEMADALGTTKREIR